MFRELRGRLAVDEELEVVAFDNDVDRVPVALIDIFFGHGPFDLGLLWFVFFIKKILGPCSF